MPIARFRQLFGLIVFLFAIPLVSYAQRGTGEYLGEANVDGGVDHDNIVVTAARGAYRAVQLRVEIAPIEFDRVLIHFGDGQTTPVTIRKRIPAGGMTRLIDLPGNRRIIQSVEFWYHRDAWKAGRPKVRLFGIH